MPLSSKDYVEKSGNVCPACGSTKVDVGGSIQADGGYAYQNCCCRDCKAKWTDEYELVGYGELTTQKNKP